MISMWYFSSRLAMNTKLFVVMGLTWACEVVTWYFQGDKTDYWWYLLDAANIFRGFFIFLIFVIKKKVRTRTSIVIFNISRVRIRRNKSS